MKLERRFMLFLCFKKFGKGNKNFFDWGIIEIVLGYWLNVIIK